MTRGAALVRALLVTLATPATWPLALAAFLVRGGILLVILPIVVLPTPVGLGNVVAPTITSVALGSVPVAAVVLTTAAAFGVVVWVVFGGWIAAALEAEGARIVARDEELDTDGRPAATGRTVSDGRVAGRILAARLVADVPFILALGWGSVRIVFVTYRELTVPSDAGEPIVARVLQASPDVVAVVIAAWMVGGIVGAIAARRIVLEGDAVLAALRAAVAMSVGHPLATLARFWLPTVVLGIVFVPSALAAAWASSVARDVLERGADPFAVLVAVVVFVGLWIAGLVLTAVICAWRAGVWTVADVLARGTFGGSGQARPGDWRPDTSSANL